MRILVCKKGRLEYHVNERVPMFDEIEIQKLAVDAPLPDIMTIYRNLADRWSWEGMKITTAILPEEGNVPRYLLVQPEDSLIYDPENPLIPYVLGYLEISSTRRGFKRPYYVRAVCAWPPVRSFWEELVRLLQPDEMKQLMAFLHPEAGVAEPELVRPQPTVKKTEIPKSAVRRRQWKRVWLLIQEDVSKGKKIAQISLWLEKHHPGLPHSTLIVGRIIRAGDNGKLDDISERQPKET